MLFGSTRPWRMAPVVGLSGLLLTASMADAAPFAVTVTIQSLAPAGGGVLTPLWVGFHDGGFDVYDSGSAAAGPFAGLEQLAEDGNTGPLSNRFTTEGAGIVQSTILGPGGPLFPGETTSDTFVLDSSADTSRYFSYAAMVIPSNDAFIANGNPLAREIFNGAGDFLGADFVVVGSMVLDAGTEVNDEIPANTPLLGQMVPNTGVDQNGVVGPHPGFIPGGNILTSFPNADFLAPGYQVAHITVTAIPVPEPASAALLVLGLAAASVGARRRRASQ